MFEAGRIQDFAPGEGELAGAFGIDFLDQDWIPTSIPGGVHSALLAADRIEDPFYADNEKLCAWMEEREWWFRIAFDWTEFAAAADEQLRLIFHGLDTFATVWLDGESLGEHENMFRPAVFDISDRLHPGSHTIAIKFDPPLLRIAGKTLSEWGRNVERSAMRKAQFGYGWDWGPRLPTIGVWRPIDIQRIRKATLVGTHFSTVALAADHSAASIAIRIEAERITTVANLIANVRLISPTSQVVFERDIPLPAGVICESMAFAEVLQPDLWWTHDLGTPALYTLETVLLADGIEIEQRSEQVGIRTLELDQSPDLDERGCRYFRFILNGVSVFARGTNWIPCESFIETIPTSRYESLITAARDANMTTLRVWGGGLWQHQPFYETCDRLGLMVWQDFMFACAQYPEDDPIFIAEVELEAAYQVRRLRNHASLSLWCGNNENQWINDMSNWNRTSRPYGELYYHQIIPEVVARLDGQTPYWPGSPFGGDDHNDRRQGNVHNWDVWHGNMPRRFGEEPKTDRSPAGVSFRRYADDMGRFISEFGMHAAPVRETLAKVIPEDHLYHHSPLMDWHNKDTPKDKGDNLMLTVTGVPQDLEEYIDFSMIAQAEGLKFGIEHFRRRKPHCSGTIVWQLNDCWPVQSWSVLDYYEMGKAGYFYLKRVFAPVLASFKEMPDGGVELWIASERQERIVESISVRLATFTGNVKWKETIIVDLAPGESKRIHGWNAGHLAAGANCYLAVRSAEETFPTNRHFFASIKDLDRVPAIVQHTINQIDSRTLDVTMEAPAGAYAYFVNIGVPHAGTKFTDNFFDLEPGERRTIMISSAQHNLSPQDITIRSR